MRPLIQVVADRVEDHGGGAVTIHRAKWDGSAPSKLAKGEVDAAFAMELAASDSGRDVEYCVRVVGTDGGAAESARTRRTMPTFDPADANPIFLFIERFNVTFQVPGDYEFVLVEFLDDGGEEALGRALFRLHRSA